MHSVLFVCLGNICRSPTAEVVFRERAARAGMLESIHVDSAGTGDWHIGKAPDRRAGEAAACRGYDLSALRARQVQPEDFDRFDFILAMDEANLRELELMRPPQFKGHLGRFLSFHSATRVREVPDPYYGGAKGFEQVLDLIEGASDGLLDHLRGQP